MLVFPGIARHGTLKSALPGGPFSSSSHGQRYSGVTRPNPLRVSSTFAEHARARARNRTSCGSPITQRISLTATQTLESCTHFLPSCLRGAVCVGVEQCNEVLIC